MSKPKIDLSHTVILSNNCIGGFLYNDYAQQFLSPTINLQIPPKDFIKFCKNIDYYSQQELVEIVSDENNKIYHDWKVEPFPIAYLGDIKVFFQHYHTFEEAQNSWIKRLARMNNLLKSSQNVKVKVILITSCFDKALYDQFCELSFKDRIYLYSTPSNVKNQNDCFYLKLPKGKRWYNYFIYPFLRYYEKFAFSKFLKK